MEAADSSRSRTLARQADKREKVMKSGSSNTWRCAVGGHTAAVRKKEGRRYLAGAGQFHAGGKTYGRDLAPVRRPCNSAMSATRIRTPRNRFTPSPALAGEGRNENQWW